MHRLLIAALVVAGCGGSGTEAPGGRAPTPGATATATSAQPSFGATTFPTAAFAALTTEPVSAATAARFQTALAVTAGEGGIAATVITPDGTWSGASGKADGVRDVSADSQFGIASVTKSIVAAQVMLLVQAGEIDLDRPAAQYLPAGFAFDANGATIRQLLSHRSGIPDWYSDAMEAQFAADRTRFWKPEELLALAGPARQPLGAFEYADTNYTLLGLVIEHVRKRPLADVLRDGALRVAGTERLIYQPEEAPSGPMAMPRGESRDALAQGGGFLSSLSDSSDGAAGGMASDTISLARWWRALCAGEVVSETSLAEMAGFYENGEIDYGLGLFNPLYKDGATRAVGHLGSSFGYKASAGCLTDDPMVVVVLTNNVRVDSQDLATPLVRAAFPD